MIFIPIGGNCGPALALRKHLNITPYALPFDYIRSNFQCIVESIKTNFSIFLPEISDDEINDCDESSYVGDYEHLIKEEVKQYHLTNHSFWHHNLHDTNVRNAFNRRSERFMSLLSSSEELIFCRLIISKTIMEEVYYRHTFFEVLNDITPNLNYKLLFFTCNVEDVIKYKMIDDKTVLITSPIKTCPIESYKTSVLFFKNYGFLNKDVIFDINTEILQESSINYTDDDINPNYVDIHIH
jgi:hypothetical protein